MKFNKKIDVNLRSSLFLFLQQFILRLAAQKAKFFPLVFWLSFLFLFFRAIIFIIIVIFIVIVVLILLLFLSYHLVLLINLIHLRNYSLLKESNNLFLMNILKSLINILLQLIKSN